MLALVLLGYTQIEPDLTSRAIPVRGACVACLVQGHQIAHLLQFKGPDGINSYKNEKREIKEGADLKNKVVDVIDIYMRASRRALP